jgi:hypothetical protein
MLAATICHYEGGAIPPEAISRLAVGSSFIESIT